MNINQYELLTTVQSILKGTPDLDGIPVLISTEINENPDVTKWIGVEPGDTEITPQGIGGCWEQVVSFRVIAQIATEGGAYGERLIDPFVATIISSITDNIDTLRTAGVIDLISGIRRVSGFRTDDEGSVRFREDEITFTGNLQN